MIVAIICGMITTASESDNQDVAPQNETVQPVPETIAEPPAEEYLEEELTPEEAMAIREGELAEEAALSEEEEEEVIPDYSEDENVVYDEPEEDETAIDEEDPVSVVEDDVTIPEEPHDEEPVIEPVETTPDKSIPEPVVTPTEDIIEPVQTTDKSIFVKEDSSNEVKTEVAQKSLKGRVNKNGYVYVGEDRAGDEVTIIF